MLASTRKAKDDFIGGRDFSRVRRYDDVARKARIFAPNAAFAIDANKVEEQLKEKKEQNHQEKMMLKEEENQRTLEKHRWDEQDKELRKQRFQARSALEQCWIKQNEEFKERWKHRPYELNHEQVGILPVQRYEFQDGEVQREADVTRRVLEAWNRQIEDHNARLCQELEKCRQNDFQKDMERKNWENSQKEISKNRLDSNVDLANMYMEQSQQKKARDKKIHDEEHKYEISKEFFEQFQTSSR